MAGKVRFKRKSSPKGWVQRLLGWFSSIWHAIMRSPQDRVDARPSGILWKTRPKDALPQGKGLVLKASQLHCPACGEELTDGAEIVRCALDPAHVVHARCSSDLVKGKCPRDGGALQPVS
jgi:hypothetical protein